MCRDSLIDSIEQYVKENVGGFHEKRMKSINELSLIKVLSRKNPYLFKAKHLEIAGEIVRAIVDAHLSSQEDGLFGGFLEGIAVLACQKSYNGRKSSCSGIDLEFQNNNKYYIVSIKSGPNWGNSGQIAQMKTNFKQAKIRLRQANPSYIIEAVNGCCYGRTQKEDKGEYYKLCGQAFWSLITGNEEFYKEIIKPIGHEARQRNELFASEYSAALNRISLEFSNKFCLANGTISWVLITEFISARRRPNLD